MVFLPFRNPWAALIAVFNVLLKPSGLAQKPISSAHPFFFLPKTNLFEKQFFVCFSPYGQPRRKTFVFLAETNLSKLSKLDRARCFSSAYPFVRSGRERKKKTIFPVFLRGKGMQKQKKHACVRAEKDFFFRIFPFFAGKRYAETKKNTRAFGQRKKKSFFFRFFPFFAGKWSVETIKKWNEWNKWSERNKQIWKNERNKLN